MWHHYVYMGLINTMWILYGVDSIYVSMYGNFTITFGSDYVESLLRDDILKS